MREDHDSAAVEVQRERQLQSAHDREDALRILGVGLDHTPPGVVRDTGALQGLSNPW
jgi:hypothetical protein